MRWSKFICPRLLPRTANLYNGEMYSLLREYSPAGARLHTVYALRNGTTGLPTTKEHEFLKRYAMERERYFFGLSIFIRTC